MKNVYKDCATKASSTLEFAGRMKLNVSQRNTVLYCEMQPDDEDGTRVAGQIAIRNCADTYDGKLDRPELDGQMCNGIAALRVYHSQFPDQRMSDDRIFQQCGHLAECHVWGALDWAWWNSPLD
ncbi:hypothetical protein TNCV_3159521 [Trichonephila clavipes]|nr:hypothetical protein TNCV_3159521 [Trichonephila clavipes]